MYSYCNHIFAELNCSPIFIALSSKPHSYKGLSIDNILLYQIFLNFLALLALVRVIFRLELVMPLGRAAF